MSAAFGLVKFKRTGNIYYGCYEGTTDIMLPFICTLEECYDKQTDSYRIISYCRKLNNQHDTWEFPDNITDLDDIEIYSSYGDGFYWNGTGSESIKMIKNYLNPFEQVYDEMTDGQPDWVKDFLEH